VSADLQKTAEPAPDVAAPAKAETEAALDVAARAAVLRAQRSAWNNAVRATPRPRGVPRPPEPARYDPLPDPLPLTPVNSAPAKERDRVPELMDPYDGGI
jgi:hypothetical protein